MANIYFVSGPCGCGKSTLAGMALIGLFHSWRRVTLMEGLEVYGYKNIL